MWFVVIPVALFAWYNKKTTGSYYGPFQPYGPFMTTEQRALNIAKNKLRVSEGDKLYVYLDTRGIPTAGIGHKVLSSDNLRVGDKITAAQRDAWFAADAQKAFNAALSQARDLGRYTPEFIAALTEVNFQLGTGWTKEFANTYNLLRQGNWQQAISNLKISAWAKQTPVRVANFVSEIQKVFSA